MEFKLLLREAAEYLPVDKIDLLQRVFHFAAAKHQGQRRMSGEPYLTLPLTVAKSLAELRQDTPTVAAALIHNVIEDCGVTVQEIELEFGSEIAKLVDGVTKLDRMDLINLSNEHTVSPSDDWARKAESIRKMLVAMAEDIRVILIKLEDRLHNMQTLEAQKNERRIAIAQETLDVYAPIAHRLGIWELKWQLEDLAFQYLDNVAYQSITRLLSLGRKTRQSYIDNRVKALSSALSRYGIQSEVSGRPKNIFSIHQQIQKYKNEGKEFDKIYDLYALRVLVSTKADCYNALGVVHSLWHPIHGSFDDYIASPKQNLYQSLHTTVMCEGVAPLEIQIRTYVTCIESPNTV